MKKFKLKKQIYLIPLIIFALTVILVPVAFGVYRTKQESNMTTKFQIIQDYDTVFVRAHVITYWVDSTNEEIAFKNPWELKTSAINSEWIKIDDFYYYKGSIPSTDITNGIPVNKELIDQSLEATDLSNEGLDNLKYIAKYKIVYDIIEASEIDGILSSEDAWGITYLSDGTPTKKE